MQKIKKSDTFDFQLLYKITEKGTTINQWALIC
jgi:hypothetical protein